MLAFLAVQALDGVLTYVGVRTAGMDEGNPLVATLMVGLGRGAGLASLKLMAGSLGIGLHLCGVHRIVATLTAVYVLAAILPWAAVLLAH